MFNFTGILLLAVVLAEVCMSFSSWSICSISKSSSIPKKSLSATAANKSLSSSKNSSLQTFFNLSTAPNCWRSLLQLWTTLGPLGPCCFDFPLYWFSFPVFPLWLLLLLVRPPALKFLWFVSLFTRVLESLRVVMSAVELSWTVIWSTVCISMVIASVFMPSGFLGGSCPLKKKKKNFCYPLHLKWENSFRFFNFNPIQKDSIRLTWLDAACSSKSFLLSDA